MKHVSTFLMFSGENYGKAKEAIELYTSIFENSKILSIEETQSDDMKNVIKQASFSIGNQSFMAHDNAYSHQFGFTPSISLFITFTEKPKMTSAFEKLQEGGIALMPLGNYGFSELFGWVQDKYGVTWQLNLVE